MFYVVTCIPGGHEFNPRAPMVGVYRESSKRIRSALALCSTATYASVMNGIIFFSVLPALLCAVDVQNTLSRDPQCVCTVNVPQAKIVDQTDGYFADENAVKSSAFLALHTQIQELQHELKKINTGMFCFRENIVY